MVRQGIPNPLIGVRFLGDLPDKSGLVKKLTQKAHILLCVGANPAPATNKEIMMENVVINIKHDFNSRPFGRTIEEYGNRSGEYFRKNFLVPPLLEGKIVHVVLDGYNRYGISFLEESFGGLVRDEGFDQYFLDQHLKVTHETLKSFEICVKRYIENEHERIFAQGVDK